MIHYKLNWSKLVSLFELTVPKAVVSLKRTFRLLEPTKSLKIPKNLVFYDVETNPTETEKGVFTHFFKMGIMSHVELNADGTTKKRILYEQYKEEDVFLDLMKIIKGRQCIWVYAHNQNYDFIASNMLEHFMADKWKIEIFSPDTKAFIIKFVKGSKTVYFLDTLNYFQGSVKSLGEELKLPKLKMPRINAKCERELAEKNYDLEEVSQNTYDYQRKWFEYNLRDVEVIEKAVLNLIAFLVDNDYGSFTYTIASMAYGIFKHQFMRSQLKIHTNIDALTLERDSYVGGRSEIFYQGKLPRGNYYILDFSSMYPFTMRSFKFPTSLIGKVTNLNVDTLIRKSDEYGVIANVDIKTDINCIPKRHDGKLCFPIGEFTTTLAQPELKLALEKGLVTNVNDAYLYHMDYVFMDYVDTFYKLKAKSKKEGRGMYAYFYKILLNSLYGKFAQRITEYEDTGLKSDFRFASGFLSNEVTGEKHFTKTIDYEVFKIIRNIESNHSMPAISSFVTSYARVHLWHAMEKAGHKNYFYCDTDSLFVNQQGYNNLKGFLRDGELGFLEKEKQSRNVIIRTVKDYTFGKKVKRKGVPSRFNEIKANIFSGDKFSRVNDIFVNEDFFKMKTRTTHKELSGVYTKGNVHEDGRVSPIILTK